MSPQLQATNTDMVKANHTTLRIGTTLHHLEDLDPNYEWEILTNITSTAFLLNLGHWLSHFTLNAGQLSSRKQ